MPRQQFVNRWLRSWGRRTAYSQLIVLIFLPLALLASVGSWLVLNETRRAALAEQRSNAETILARQQQIANSLIRMLEDNQVETSQKILQDALSESNVLRAALMDQQHLVRLSVGQQKDLPWPAFPIDTQSFGPILIQGVDHDANAYGQRVGYSETGPIWLVIDMNNQPMQIARLKLLITMAVSALLTLLTLLIFLNFYSRRWITPLYEMRLQLGQMSADNLDQPLRTVSRGELRWLQKDINRLLKRISDSFDDVRQYSAQAEADLQQTLDTLEMQNIIYRNTRDHAIKSNSLKSVFLANISHELRTPLNSIDGFVTLLQKKGGLSAEQTLYVQTIQKSSRHLLALINDVLDFSRIESGKLELEQAPFDLEDAVFEVMDMLSPMAAEKNLDMAVFFYDDVPRDVIGDALRFRQVLTNLVSNAVKFTREGEVIVRVRLDDEDTGSTSTHPSLIHISVQDTGVGLSSIDKEKLFESFGQGDPSVTRQFGGTGLGLSIAKQLTAMMGGQIGLDDRQEVGATFWFTISLPTRATFDPAWPDLTGMPVLMWVSHAASRYVLEGYLHRLQVDLTVATSLADMLGHLGQFQERLLAYGNGHLIVQGETDNRALLREIRRYYQGDILIYDYPMSVEPDLLNTSQPRIHILPQPVSRRNLLALLDQPSDLAELEPTGLTAGLQVLVVDDHPANLMVVEAFLHDMRVGVETASHGQEAIDKVRERFQLGRRYDLILMDIQMPRLSGLEATEAIRTLETELGQPRTPVVALTAHALAEERQRLTAAGMDDYASKPIQQDTLLRLLRRWTGQPGLDASEPASRLQPEDIGWAIPDQAGTIHPYDDKAIDWLESVQLAAGKPELAFDLLKIMLGSLGEERQQLADMDEQGKLERLEQLAHRIYGATRYVGTPTLRYAAQQLERRLIQSRHDEDQDDPLVQQEIRELVQIALAAIDQLLAYPLDRVAQQEKWL